jgi:prepilin peptidase CpaA
MLQTDLKMLALLPLIGGLFCAAWIDVRQRRIPNWLTAAIGVAGLAQSVLPVHFASPGAAVAGFGAGFGVGLIMFALRAFGGGDVKLLAAVGAWLGPFGVVQTVVVAALVGLVMVLAQCVCQGRLRVLFRNSAVLSLNLASVQQIGVDGVIDAGTSAPRSVDRPLPYAVPVLVAVLVLVCL